MSKALLFIALLSPLQASIVGFNYTGTVDGLQGPPEPLFAGAAIGNQVSGSFTYEAIQNPNGQTASTYILKSEFLQLGPLAYALSAPVLAIDVIGEYDWEAGGQCGKPVYGLNLVLRDTVNPYVQTDVLLRPPPDPSTVDTHYGLLEFLRSPESNSTILDFNIDSISSCAVNPVDSLRLPACNQPSNVPEPATLSLLSMPLVLLVFRRRRGIRNQTTDQRALQPTLDSPQALQGEKITAGRESVSQRDKSAREKAKKEEEDSYVQVSFLPYGEPFQPERDTNYFDDESNEWVLGPEYKKRFERREAKRREVEQKITCFS